LILHWNDNPFSVDLRNHYNMIQAIALELESKPQSDQLLPNYEYIDQVIMN
jgi:hypothetical protein